MQMMLGMPASAAIGTRRSSPDTSSSWYSVRLKPLSIPNPALFIAQVSPYFFSVGQVSGPTSSTDWIPMR